MFNSKLFKGFIVASLLLVTLFAISTASADPDPRDIYRIDNYYDSNVYHSQHCLHDDECPIVKIKYLPQPEKAYIGYCKVGATVYAGPGTKFEVLDEILVDKVVELKYWNNGETWCKVMYNDRGNIGWVQGQYIIPYK